MNFTCKMMIISNFDYVTIDIPQNLGVPSSNFQDSGGSRGMSMHMEVLPSSAPKHSFMRKPPSHDIRGMFSGYSTWNIVSGEGSDDTAATIVMNSQEKLRDYSSKRLGKDQTSSLPNGIAASVAAAALIDSDGMSGAAHAELLRDCELLLAAVDKQQTSSLPISTLPPLPGIPPGVSYSKGVGAALSRGGSTTISELGIHSYRMELLPPPCPQLTACDDLPPGIHPPQILQEMKEPTATAGSSSGSSDAIEGGQSTGQTVLETGDSVSRFRQKQSLADLLQDNDDFEEEEEEKKGQDNEANTEAAGQGETIHTHNCKSLQGVEYVVSEDVWGTSPGPRLSSVNTSTVGSSGVNTADDDALMKKIASLHSDGADDSLVDHLMQVNFPPRVGSTAVSLHSDGGSGLGGDSAHLQWASTVPLPDSEFEALR